jgi:hypothetical protein
MDDLRMRGYLHGLRVAYLIARRMKSKSTMHHIRQHHDLQVGELNEERQDAQKLPLPLDVPGMRSHK